MITGPSCGTTVIKGANVFIKVEEFKNKDECNVRLKELRERGYNPSNCRVSRWVLQRLPVKWEDRFYLAYDSEQRKRRKGKKIHAAS
jgi:hypothetical protein